MNNVNTKWFVLISTVFAVLMFAYWQKQSLPAVAGFTFEPAKPYSNTLIFESSTLPSTGSKASHAPFLVESPAGEQVVFWFSGQKEGHRDVHIVRAKLRNGQLVEAPQKVLGPTQLSALAKRYIKNVGNPVVWYQQGRLVLAVVNVSVGGWATARVDILSSEDEGLTFQYERVLRASPFFNISTLIRTRPLVSEQGVLLPAYFELGRLNPMMVHLDNQLALQHTSTLPVRAIQSALALQGDNARLISRPMGQQSLQVVDYRPSDTQMVKGSEFSMTLPNASSAVSVVQLQPNVLLMAHNPGDSRKRLALSISRDGGVSWSLLYEFPNAKSAALAYPSLLQGQDGVLHLVYSESKAVIQYHRFTLAGLAAKAGGAQ